MKFNEYRQIRADKEREIAEKIVEYQERLNLLDIPEDAPLKELCTYFQKNNIGASIKFYTEKQRLWVDVRKDSAYVIGYTPNEGFVVNRNVGCIYDIEEQDLSDGIIGKIERCFNNEPEPPEPEYHRPWWDIFKDKWEMFWEYSVTGVVLKVVFTILWIGSALGMLAFLLSNTKL